MICNFFYELSNSTPRNLPLQSPHPHFGGISHWFYFHLLTTYLLPSNFFITLNLIKQSNFYVKMFFHSKSYEYIVFPYNALDHKSMYIS